MLGFIELKMDKTLQFLVLWLVILSATGFPISEHPSTKVTIPNAFRLGDISYPHGSPLPCGSTRALKAGDIFYFRNVDTRARHLRNAFSSQPHYPQFIQPHFQPPQTTHLLAPPHRIPPSSQPFPHPYLHSFPFPPPHPRPYEHVKPRICEWSFFAVGSCQLVADFEHYEGGDLNCNRQYMLLADEEREIQICGFAPFPGLFKSVGRKLQIKHLRKPQTWSAEFEGYVTCIKPRRVPEILEYGPTSLEITNRKTLDEFKTSIVIQQGKDHEDKNFSTLTTIVDEEGESWDGKTDPQDKMDQHPAFNNTKTEFPPDVNVTQSEDTAGEVKKISTPTTITDEDEEAGYGWLETLLDFKVTDLESGDDITDDLESDESDPEDKEDQHPALNFNHTEIETPADANSSESVELPFFDDEFRFWLTTLEDFYEKDSNEDTTINDEDDNSSPHQVATEPEISEILEDYTGYLLPPIQPTTVKSENNHSQYVVSPTEASEVRAGLEDVQSSANDDLKIYPSSPNNTLTAAASINSESEDHGDFGYLLAPTDSHVTSGDALPTEPHQYPKISIESRKPREKSTSNSEIAEETHEENKGNNVLKDVDTASENDPNKNLPVAEKTPADKFAVAEHIPTDVVEVVEPTTRDEVEVVEPTPRNEVEVVEPTSKDEVEVVDPTPRDEVEVVEPTPKDEVEVVEPTSKEVEVVEPTAKDEVKVVEPTPRDEVEVVEPTSKDKIEVVEPTSKDENEVVAPTSKEEIEVVEPTPKDEVELVEPTPMDAVEVVEQTSGDGVKVADKPSEDVVENETAEQTSRDVVEGVEENQKDLETKELESVTLAVPSEALIPVQAEGVGEYLETNHTFPLESVPVSVKSTIGADNDEETTKSNAESSVTLRNQPSSAQIAENEVVQPDAPIEHNEPELSPTVSESGVGFQKGDSELSPSLNILTSEEDTHEKAGQSLTDPTVKKIVVDESLSPSKQSDSEVILPENKTEETAKAKQVGEPIIKTGFQPVNAEVADGPHEKKNSSDLEVDLDESPLSGPIQETNTEVNPISQVGAQEDKPIHLKERDTSPNPAPDVDLDSIAAQSAATTG